MDNLHNYIVNASETLSFVSLIIFMIICTIVMCIRMFRYDAKVPGVILIFVTIFQSGFLWWVSSPMHISSQEVISQYQGLGEGNRLIMQTDKMWFKRHMEFEVFVNKSKNEKESGYIILNVKDKHAIEMTKSEFEQIKDKLNPQGVVPKEINKVGDTHD